MDDCLSGWHLGYRMDKTTWMYWWTIQVGMVFGAVTAYPANYLLLKGKIKEPCCQDKMMCLMEEQCDCRNDLPPLVGFSGTMVQLDCRQLIFACIR